MKKITFMALLMSMAQVSFSQITGVSDICPGGFETYTYVDVDPCDSAYTWTITPAIGTIVGSNDSPFIQVEWNAPGTAQLCVSVADSCANTMTPYCLSVVVSPIPTTLLEADICQGDCVNIAANVFCNPGVFQVVLTNWLGCDSVIEVVVNQLPPSFTDLGEIPIPCGGAFDVCGQTFNQIGGPQTVVCVNSLGCDSTVIFTLMPNDVIVNAGADAILNCFTTEVALDGSLSSSGPEFTYQWTGPNSFSSTVMNPIVSLPGNYCLTVTNTMSGCQATDCVGVFEDVDIPFISVLDAILPCDGSEVIINSTFTGVTNATLQWTTVNGNIISGANTSTPVVNSAGIYCLIVSDLNTGCSAEECMEVFENPQIVVTGSTEVCPGNTETYVAQLISNDAATAFYFSENGAPPTEILVNSNAATYETEITESIVLSIWAIDDGPCESDTTYINVTLNEYEIDFTVNPSSCQPTDVTATVNGMPASNFTFDWNTGDQGNQISVTSTGMYYVTATDFSNCSEVDSLFVTVDYTGACAFVEGNVLDDQNLDCAFDAGDLPLAGWLVEVVGSSATFFGTTDAAGFYFIPVDPGDYTVSVFPPTNLWLPCDNDIDVSLPNLDDVATADFFIEKLPGCPQMTVDISTWILRRCFTNNYYNIDYCNEGVEIATDVYVELEVDPLLFVLGASVPYVDLGDNLFQFEIGTVDVGECGSFHVDIEVSCDALLGQTHCTEARIFPDTLCGAPDPSWSGADLETEVECSDSVRFTITNNGTGTMAESLSFVVIEDAVMYMEVPDGPTLESGQSYTVAVPANGSTWRLEVVQEPFHPSESSFQIAVIEACGVNTLGNVSSGFVEMFSMFDEDNFVDVDCRDNVGSYDPNDKQGSPLGYGDDHLILPGTDIEYLIRFQNTGTDTAFNIVIRDTLAEELDVTTMRPGTSSHPYDFEVYGGGILKFTFADIMLPDSNINEPLSHGFVEFKIAHRPDLPLGTVIENSAAIYFDFNEPIITNTTDHKLAVDFPAVNHVEVALPGVKMEVYPNPFDATFRVNVSGIYYGNRLNFSLLDPVGRLVRTERFTAPGFDMNVQNLPSGFYFFKVEMEGQLVGSGKIVKE